MRIMTSGPSSSPLAGTILAFFYIYFFLHWATGILMFREKLGFSRETVTRYYLGDPEMFMNPRSFAGLLEVTHFHLFAMGFFFVVFTHLLLYTPFRQGFKTLLVWALAIAIVGDLSGGWLVRYVGASFASLKLVSFWLLQGASLLLFLGLITAPFLRKRSER